MKGCATMSISLPTSPNVGNLIFALDIGTRTVIGITGFMDGDEFHIAAQEMMEHEGRFMFDGQIHDIPRVAKVVASIKAELEKKNGLSLEKVAVAAAGRSLKTVRCQVEMEHESDREIETLDIRGLELAALRQAHHELDGTRQGAEGEDFYCVGHCVIRYLVDNMAVSNLQGHKGRLIGAEIVATFLPASVVNSLYAVLQRAGLEPVNLTLEPIAAIDVAIPPSFRLLNLAMVDIGAGTSDIAITRDGSIVAYGMVPIAGDEITEPIMEKLLVEFSEAEKIKRALAQEGEITYTDILGMTNTVAPEEVLSAIDYVLDKLIDTVSAEILELNGGTPPKSVFCVGGGSRIPTLTERLARRLQIDHHRVVVRDRSFLRHVTGLENDPLAGPEGVTVVGIATVALARMGYEFMTVKINGNAYKLFNTKNINVSQALGLIRFDPRNLIGKNGRDLKFILNGRQHIVFGDLAEHARILVNDQDANLQSPVRDGDEIIVIKATQGRDASARVADFLPVSDAIAIRFNGKQTTWSPRATLNGGQAEPDALLKPGDKLDVLIPTVEAVAAKQGMNCSEKEIRVNGRGALASAVVSDGAVIEISTSNQMTDEMKITLNGEELLLPRKQETIFVDVFNYMQIDTTQPRGTLVMKLNGAPARYTQKISAGDRIDLYWEEN
ncbi:MAG: hypothetical protein JL56_06910 [Desulfotomaculum sp. BICA1-6]|nr:MAG: hypothetical protein JL56_06910 [Desulfotomaculum sp. BICA1-6]